jgi:hypothetical protein
MISGLKYGLSVGILVTQRLSDRTRSTYYLHPDSLLGRWVVERILQVIKVV